MLARLAAIVVLCCLAAPAHAEWKSTRQVTLGTAQVLEQGELSFGVLAMPVAFGLTPRLTLQTHPLLDLLLVPNVGGRYKLPWELSSWVFSVTADFRRSFFFGASTASVRATSTDGRPCSIANASGYGSQTDAACVTPGQSPPGELSVGAVVSWYPARWLALSASPLYAARLGGVDAPGCTNAGGCPSWHHGAGVSVQGHLLLSRTDLLAASAFVRYDSDYGSWRLAGPGFDQPTGELAWVHQFPGWLSDVHLVAGMSYGSFTLREFCGTGCKSAWNVFPMIDLWWRR